MDSDDELLDQVGRRIRELRERALKTQAEIAEATSTTTGNYQRIEAGSQNLTLKTLAKIARAIGVEVADFLVKPETPRPPRGRPKKARLDG